MAHVDRIGHVVLRIADVDRAVGFYRDMLGMEAVRYDSEAGMAFMSFGRQHHDIGLFRVKGEESRGSLGLGHIAMAVDGDLTDLKELHDRLVANGTDVHLTDHGMTKSVYFEDPDGNHLELFVDLMSHEDGKRYLAERKGRGDGTFTFTATSTTVAR